MSFLNFDSCVDFDKISSTNVNTIANYHRNNMLLISKDNPTINNSNQQMDKLNKNLYNTDVYKIFLSNKNINRIQKNIKKSIYKSSYGHYILKQNQNEDDLLKIMNDVYYNNALYDTMEPIRQVKYLNKLVVDEVTDKIMISIKQQQKYLKDLTTPVSHQILPVNTKIKNQYKSLSSIYGI